MFDRILIKLVTLNLFQHPSLRLHRHWQSHGGPRNKSGVTILRVTGPPADPLYAMVSSSVGIGTKAKATELSATP